MNTRIPIFAVLLLLAGLVLAVSAVHADVVIPLSGTVSGEVYELTATPTYPSGSTVPPDADISFTFPVPVLVVKDYIIPTLPYVEDWQVGIVRDAHDPRVIHLRPQLSLKKDREQFPHTLKWPAGQVVIWFNGDEVVSEDENYGSWKEYSYLAGKSYTFTVTAQGEQPKILATNPPEGAVVEATAEGCVGQPTIWSHPDQVLKTAFLFEQPIKVIDKTRVKTSGSWGTWEGSIPFDPPDIFGRYMLTLPNIRNIAFYGPAMTGEVTITLLPGAVQTLNGLINDREINLSYKVNPVNIGEFKANPSPGQNQEIPKEPAEEWRARIEGIKVTAPVRGSGAVYVGGDRLRKFTENGMLEWEKIPGHVADEYSLPVIASDGVIYTVFKGDRCYLESYNADGTLRFSVPLPGGEYLAPPAILPDGDIVVVSKWATSGLAYSGGNVITHISPAGFVKSAVRADEIDDEWEIISAESDSVLLALPFAKSSGADFNAVVKIVLPESGVYDISDAPDLVFWSYPITSAEILYDVAGGNDYVYVLKGDSGGNNANLVVLSKTDGRIIKTITIVENNKPEVKAIEKNDPRPITCVSGNDVYVGNYQVNVADGNVVHLGKSVIAVDDNGAKLHFTRGNGRKPVITGNGWEQQLIDDGFYYVVGSCFGSLYVVIDTSRAGQPYLIKYSDQQPQSQPQPVRLEVRPGEATVKVGESVQFYAVAVYSDNSERNVTQEATWSISTPAVASVNVGLATGIAPGQTDVIATWQGLTGTAKLTVVQPQQPAPAIPSGDGGGVAEPEPVKEPQPVKLEVTPKTADLLVGDSVQLEAVLHLSDGSTKGVTRDPATSWKSEAEGVASVGSGPDGGKATGVAPGRAKITATYAGLIDDAAVTVRELTGKVYGYVFDKDDKPVADVRVELHSTPRVAFTDSEGYYEFQDVPFGRHTVLIADTRLEQVQRIDVILDVGGQRIVREGSDRAEVQLARAEREKRVDFVVVPKDTGGTVEIQIGGGDIPPEPPPEPETTPVKPEPSPVPPSVMPQFKPEPEPAPQPEPEPMPEPEITPQPEPEPALEPGPAPEKEKRRIFWYPVLLLLILPFIRRSVNVSVEIRRDPGDVKAVVYRDVRGPKTVKVVAYINGDKHSVFNLDRDGQHVIGITPDSYALVEIKTPGRRNVSRKKTATYGGVLDNVLDK
ncbi:MAG: Ig-like domain-containing protein [Armatimonadetes bacterium]|nr:Ig-like domain-containing protein [Armatimonadota bacterium]